jgi:acyl-CoA reductase-like NAD-dependent aldehyde dehydrogenase
MTRSIDLLDPSTEAVIETVPLISVEETDAAVNRAVSAQRDWAELAPADRARLLRRFAAAVDGDLENLARLEVRNAGHTIGNARWEAGNVRDVLNYFSAAPERLSGRQIPVAGGVDLTFKEPIGVVGVIVPWNFPMPIAGWGFAPALAAGNAVLLKPAELTPLTALRLAELALEAGLPEYVFQVLPGAGPVVGTRFVTHPQVRKVVFTGSTRVGKEILRGCAEQIKRVTLELGGKSAFILLDDSDLDAALPNAVRSCFVNNGQTCAALTRLIVPRAMLPDVEAGVAELVGAMRVGDPLDPATGLGPLVSAGQQRSVRRYITQGIEEGATLVTGGDDVPDGLDRGYYVRPTVFSGVTREMVIAREEIFGPVLAVLPADSEDDAVDIANDSIYGLSGAVWSSDQSRAIAVARRLRTGQVAINGGRFNVKAPFGGYKQSGIGRELGEHGLGEYFELTSLQLPAMS